MEAERDAALRIITSGGGTLQPRMVAGIAELIEEETAAARYEPPVETETLAYAIVKLAEAFLFSDAVAGMRGDVDRLRDVEAALLGVMPRRSAAEASRRTAASSAAQLAATGRSASDGSHPTAIAWRPRKKTVSIVA